MRRRSFVRSFLTAAGGASAFGVKPVAGTSRETVLPDERIDPLTFRTACSLVGEDGAGLSDGTVPVRSEPSAKRVDADGNGDVTTSPGDRLPLVAVEGNVVGVGGPLVTDDHDFAAGNEEFLANVWDQLLGSGTVVWEEAHEQAYDFAEDYDQFKHYAIERGYEVGATEDFADALRGDAIVVASPGASYTPTQRTELRSFVREGGVVFLHGRSDAENEDGTDHLNALCSALGVGFRFEDDQVVDPDNNAGDKTRPRTRQFDAAFPYFDDRQGLDDFGIDGSEKYAVDVFDVADGDTIDVRFDSGVTETIRVLGVDTPETEPNDRFERPEEWEGLAYDYYRSTLERLRFENACSLRAPDGSPLTDRGSIAVLAEPSAETENTDGEGTAVDYGDDRIPLVAVDGGVVGFGATMLASDADYEADNEEFVVNVWNEYLGSGTVLWDEGHGQFHTLDRVAPFPSYAADNNYSVVATGSVVEDLSTADGVVITAPGEAFSAAELDALGEFVDDGGAVFLHDRADYRNRDGTRHLNEVAAALDLGFRFDDDQVLDREANDGEPFQPVTTAFSEAHPSFFLDRAGSDGGAIDRSSRHLLDSAAAAKEFARERLSDRRVRIAFDSNESVRDQFDRLLAYVFYEGPGEESRDTLYNEELIASGHARVYGSGMDRHREFWLAESEARSAGRGVWADSDVGSAPSYRNRPVERVFFPKPASVRTADGRLPTERAPVRAASSARQGGGGVAYEADVPLVGVDPEARVAMVGAPLIDEGYEQFEGYPVDTSVYDNYVLVSNLVAGLTDREGEVLIDGGHGQFNADHALSSEDAAYYQRFLEGQGIGLEQRNRIAGKTLADGRALLVTTPASAFTDDELSAIEGFRDDGGAVVLFGSGAVSSDRAGALNAVAEALGTDLRLNADAVTDPMHPLDGSPDVFETGAFPGEYGGLFDAYDGSVTFPDRALRDADSGGSRSGSTTTAGGPNDARNRVGDVDASGSADDGGGGLLVPIGLAAGGFAAGVGAIGLRRRIGGGDDDE